MVGREGIEPPQSKTADLQSAELTTCSTYPRIVPARGALPTVADGIRPMRPPQLIGDNRREGEREKRAEEREHNVEVQRERSPPKAGRTMGRVDGLEPTSGFEPETSSLPRKCSAN